MLDKDGNATTEIGEDETASIWYLDGEDWTYIRSRINSNHSRDQKNYRVASLINLVCDQNLSLSFEAGFRKNTQQTHQYTSLIFGPAVCGFENSSPVAWRNILLAQLSR